MAEATNITSSEIKNQYTATYYKKWRVYEAVVSTNETITTTGLGTLTAAVGIRKDTGAAITCTVALGAVTVTSTLSDIPCVVLAVGETGS